MKAALIKEHGGPDKLQFGELPDPSVKEGELLIRVKACALNHVDIWVRNGSPAYPVKMPHVLGADIAGEIVGGEGSTIFKGKRVLVSPGWADWKCPQCLAGHDNQCENFKIIGAAMHGGYGEFVAVPARNVFPIPDHLSFEEAASFPLVFLTAWHMLITRAKLAPGETVLVLGAGSGVGSAAIQIAKLAGAQVIAVSTSDEKLAEARKLGADHGINARNDFSKEARAWTGGRGVDVVFEHVGPETWEKSVRSLAVRGRLVTCGATTGPTASLDLRYIFSRDLTILGARLGTRAEMGRIVDLLSQKRFKPVVSKVFPLKEARAAHEFLENKSQFGKVVLKV